MLVLVLALLHAASSTGASRPAADIGGEEALVVLERSGQCGSWRASIYASGHANAMSEDTCGRDERTFSRLLKVSPEAVASVQAALREAKFFELPGHVEPITVVPDDDFLSLRAQSGPMRHSMVVQGDQLSGSIETIKRFRAVWEAVGKVVPEPAW